MSYGEDDAVLSRARSATTVEALLRELKWWYSWGEYDSTGAEILTRLGELGQNNPDAIDALAYSAQGQIARTSGAALKALRSLAAQGDLLAITVLDEFAAERLATEAVQLGMTVEALQQQRQAEQTAAAARQQASLNELAAEASALGITEAEVLQRRSRAEVEQKARQSELESRQQRGASQFHPGQRVVCLIPGWKYLHQIGVVERAVNRQFISVRFDDGYLTTQSEDKFTAANR